MKKLLLLLVLSTLCLFGCGKGEQTNEEINEQLKAMASEIVFEEEQIDEPLSFDETPKKVYEYTATVKNPTKTKFKDFYFVVHYVDEDGNEEEKRVGDVNVEWKPKETNTFYLSGVLGNEKKIASYEIVSINWLKEGNDDYVTVNLSE